MLSIVISGEFSNIFYQIYSFNDESPYTASQNKLTSSQLTHQPAVSPQTNIFQKQKLEDTKEIYLLYAQHQRAGFSSSHLRLLKYSYFEPFPFLADSRGWSENRQGMMGERLRWSSSVVSTHIVRVLKPSNSTDDVRRGGKGGTLNILSLT